MLRSWPPRTIAKLEALVSAFSDTNPYAVFDADGTLWDHDLSEGLLLLLENENILAASKLPPTQFPLPISREESLFTYYLRLCQAEVSLGYFWLCQVFSGFTTGDLKTYIDELLSSSSALPYTMLNEKGERVEKEIQRPYLFQWQKELIAFLQENGVTVYVVTASQEELVRMVVADPQYGYNIPSQNVIGMRLALRAPAGNRFLTIAEKELDTTYYNSSLTTSLSGITTWYSGKPAAIRAYIAPLQRPVLAAGNSESDFEMLDYAEDVPGMRILVTDSAELLKNLQETVSTNAQNNERASFPGLHTNGWEVVQPTQF